MGTSRRGQAIRNFDEIVAVTDADFEAAGLKVDTVFRIARLAVIEGRLIEGVLGSVDLDSHTGSRSASNRCDRYRASIRRPTQELASPTAPCSRAG